MAEEKNKSERSAPAKSAAEPASGPLNAQNFQRTIQEALQQYSQTLRDAYAKGVKRSEELYQEYLKSQREQQAVFDESIKEDYRSYVGSMQKVWGNEQAQTKMDEASRGYLTAITERQNELRSNLDDLYRKYLDTVQKHEAGVQQEFTTAYQDYLRAFQQAWVRADVTALDTQTLASVGQVLIAASGYAGQTLPVA